MDAAKMQRLLSFSKALWRFVSKGRGQFLPPDKIQERLNVCMTCEHFTGSRCSVCGCGTTGNSSLLNKLAYPTEECPEGKWSRVQ